MWVRSSIAFYGNFNLDMGRSPGFGSACTDYSALLRLGFPSAPDLKSLTSPAPATRRTVLQKVRGPALVAVPQLVNTGFQVLFHSPPGVLFTFPSRYFSSIGHQVVFSLMGWSPLLSYEIPRVSFYSGYYLASSSFIYGTLTLFGLLSQTIPLDS